MDTQTMERNFYCHLLPGIILIIVDSASGIPSADTFVISLGVIDK